MLQLVVSVKKLYETYNGRFALMGLKALFRPTQADSALMSSVNSQDTKYVFIFIYCNIRSNTIFIADRSLWEVLLLVYIWILYSLENNNRTLQIHY